MSAPRSEMPAAAALLRNQPELRARLAGSDMLSRLKSRLQQVTIGDETLWVAEGDLLLASSGESIQFRTSEAQRERRAPENRQVRTIPCVGNDVPRPGQA